MTTAELLKLLKKKAAPASETVVAVTYTAAP